MTNDLDDIIRAARNLGRADMAYWIFGAATAALIVYGLISGVWL